MSFWNVCFISYNEKATTDSTHSTVLQSWDPSSTSDAYLTVLRMPQRQQILIIFIYFGNLKFLVQLGFPARGQDLRVAVLQHESALLPFRIYPTQDAMLSGTSGSAALWRLHFLLLPYVIPNPPGIMRQVMKNRDTNCVTTLAPHTLTWRDI